MLESTIVKELKQIEDIEIRLTKEEGEEYRRLMTEAKAEIDKYR